jgi:small-conductance mechanosensitive channel
VDDAFRVGEDIEVGDVRGTVERIGIRSTQLRHLRGAVNIVPHGAVLTTLEPHRVPLRRPEWSEV